MENSPALGQPPCTIVSKKIADSPGADVKNDVQMRPKDISSPAFRSRDQGSAGISGDGLSVFAVGLQPGPSVTAPKSLSISSISARSPRTRSG